MDEIKLMEEINQHLAEALDPDQARHLSNALYILLDEIALLRQELEELRGSGEML